MVSQRSPAVPFGEIVGQEALKTGLLAVAAHGDLDGLLVRGEKGTAKSTAVRGLAELLPDQQAVADCPYGCSPTAAGVQCAECAARDSPPVETRPVPLVTLPLGATRERVVGSLSVTDALDGDPQFEPGLLAAANRGILYVDEVNLLDDHLVDVLLDAAASGVNHVERDGVSVTHPAEFTLVGTMNPEEGDLRPQLRDRFALSVRVSGSDDLDERMEVLDRALDGAEEPSEPQTEITDDPAEPQTESDPTAAARDRLLTARDLLDGVTLPEDCKRDIVELCRDAGVDGHRGDIATARAARALSALEGRPTVIESDVRRAAEFALPHRLRSDPFEDAPDPEELIDEQFDDENKADADEGSGEESEQGESGEAEVGDDGGNQDAGAGEHGNHQSSDQQPQDQNNDGQTSDEDDRAGSQESDPSPQPDARSADASEGTEQREQDPTPSGDGENGSSNDGDTETATPMVPGSRATPAPGEAAAPPLDTATIEAGDTEGSGARTTTSGTDADGPRLRSERATAEESIDAAASVRAAAARGGAEIGERDLRQSVRSTQGSALVVVAVDASASMRGPMRAAKGAVLELLQDAYEHRDEVAVVAFAGTEAEVVLPPTDSVSMAARHLKELPTADRTPLPAGIDTTAAVIDRAEPDAAVAVLVTDGRATGDTESPTAATKAAAKRLGTVADRVLVVDAGDRERSLVGTIETAADAQVVPLSALTPETLDRAVEETR